MGAKIERSGELQRRARRDAAGEPRGAAVGCAEPAAELAEEQGPGEPAGEGEEAGRRARWRDETQVFPLVVQIVKLVLKRKEVTSKMGITLGMFFKQIDDMVSTEMIEQALQRCYLDADSLESSKMEAVAANFDEIVKALDALQLIEHVPSRESADAKVEKAEEPAEPAKPAEAKKEEAKKEEEEEKEKPIKDEAKFLEILETHTMGQELSDLVEKAGLGKDTRRGGEMA